MVDDDFDGNSPQDPLSAGPGENPLDAEPEPDEDSDLLDAEPAEMDDDEPDVEDEEPEEKEFDTGIYAIKTTASQERTVADMIMNREEPSIHAALAPDSLTSYVMVEADDHAVFDRILDEIPHANGVVPGESSIAEVEHFLSPKPDVEGIAEGDIVELIAGPFKGEKAQVQRIDEGKDQVTVELYEATVPIPVTVRGDQIRVLDSEER
jgi:transcriptional antiterminator NusG